MSAAQVVLACCIGYFGIGLAVAEVYAKAWRRDDMRALVAEMASRLETTPHSVVNVFSLIGGMYWPVSVPMSTWFAVRDRLRRRRAERDAP